MVTIDSIDTDELHEIIVNGEIDASSSIHLDNALENAFNNYKSILINLEDLTYISSAGLGVFIARLEEMKEKEVKMVLFGLNDKVRNVFMILGLEELLTIKQDKKEALEVL